MDIAAPLDPEHINVMIWTGLWLKVAQNDQPVEWPVLDHHGRITGTETLHPENADRIGQMLLDANARAADSEHHTETLYVYSYQRPQHTTWRVIEILRAIHAYEYDTCRIKGWLTSRAYHYCAAISHRLTQQLPGYLSAQPRITTQTWPAMAKEWHPENR